MSYGRYLKNNPNSTIPFIKNNIKEYYNIYRINDMENIPNLMYKYMDNLLTSTFDILGSEYIQKDIDIEDEQLTLELNESISKDIKY